MGPSVLQPHLLCLPPLPNHHCNLWPLLWGSLALVSVYILCLFSLSRGGGIGFSLNRGYTYVFIDVETFTMCWT